MSTVSIFLVEDSAVIRTSLSAALEDLAPVKVIGFAESADQACRCLSDFSVAGCCDLAIVDVFLKGGSGLDVLRCISVNAFAFNTVVLTNYATPAIRSKCLSLGATRVFDKSCEVDELISYCQTLAND
jgi:DNA-binding NarL/FixJ family response regulator